MGQKQKHPKTSHRCVWIYLFFTVGELKLKMPGKKAELRVDPADGKAYPLDSFLEFYGEDEGPRRWATAGQQPSYTGISLLHVCV